MGINRVFTDEDSPEMWVEAGTKMIKKIEKPTEKDYRPIALVDVSCKLVCSFMEKGIEDHLVESKMVLENQMGFTKGGSRVQKTYLSYSYPNFADCNLTLSARVSACVLACVSARVRKA